MVSNDVKAKLILEQVVEESKAQMFYEGLISSNVLLPEDVEIIREIIADEANHTLKLIAMAKRYNRISASPDGLENTLKEIGNLETSNSHTEKEYLEPFGVKFTDD